ncbi:MAG TPA: DUF2235 domain-containing protein [Xanthobacteraceae bacterium]|nr:DUF2235 domain-containing protein [Xanthobacteraceae bacterium]
MSPKRIVVLSDGTGNAASSIWRTNVWRVFEALDLSNDDQVAKYDDGVGSSAFIPLALLGGAFGWGLKRNVIDLYKFVCRNYAPGVQIYAFGFSRGAFTVRVLAAFMLHEGLVPYTSESDLHSRARDAYRAYRTDKYHSVLRVETVFRKLRDLLVGGLNRFLRRRRYDRADNTPLPSIEFIGVWDTVAAYGLPIEEMTRGVSRWIWPLELPGRKLHPSVKRACHALALDDERTTFHPVLWTEEGEAAVAPDEHGKMRIEKERLSQVWFVGMHANVGGGYPDDSLAYLPLFWIMNEAWARGLRFKQAPKADPDAFRRAISARDKEGRLYDSRSGLGGYYRYGPRKIADLSHARLSSRDGDRVDIALPKIHESALARMRGDSNAYAPIGLPPAYAVVMDNGEIRSGADNPFEQPAEAAMRAKEQEKVWNLVWFRRIMYFCTLAAALHLLLFWLFHDRNPEREFTSPVRMVSEFVRLVESFLPRNAVHWWTDWYAANPVSFLLGVIAVVVLTSTGSSVGLRINDAMRVIWTSRGQRKVVADSALHDAIFALRTHPIYQWILIGLKRHLLPFLSAVFLIWLGATATSHFAYNVADSLGAFCRDSPESKRSVLAAGKISEPIAFQTGTLCMATGVLVENRARYLITIDVTSEWGYKWGDSNFPASPLGVRTADFPDWWRKLASYSLVPMRRVIFRPWLQLFARIGSMGVDEYFLDAQEQDSNVNPYTRRMRAERSGELFFYVNEAVVPIPGLVDIFFHKHSGTAKLTIKRL